MSGVKYTEADHWTAEVAKEEGTWEDLADTALPILMNASPRLRREMLGALLQAVCRYGEER